jgi:uncharacterized protein (TIGR01777 family)
MATILITGGTGLVGTRLAKLLSDKGYTVNLLSRSVGDVKPPYNKAFYWDIEKQEMDEAALANCDYIIHLAGAGIADKPWTKERKKEIIDSRVESSNLLHSQLKYKPNSVKAVIAASATGYYGAITTDKLFKETDPAANDFLGQCCLAWEESVKNINALGIRTVNVRTGVVLSTKGGALEKIAGLAKFGPVAAVGSGKQAMPWIHIDDICDIYIKAIEDETMQGPYNAIAPAKDDSISFTKALGKQIHRPMLPIPAPAFAIRLLYGEMSVTVLEGSHVDVSKIQAVGYLFKFTDVQAAIKDLYERGI